MIIWLMGISGAGKTTIGNRLKAYFNELEIKNYLIDGDHVRSFFNHDLGYSVEERRENIKRIILGAYILDENDVAGIVCNIAPFEDLRILARTKIAGYNEIWLKKDVKKSIESDVKNVYKNHKGKTELIGIDIGFEEPANSDLTIDVDKTNENETFNMVKQFLRDKYGLDCKDSTKDM